MSKTKTKQLSPEERSELEKVQRETLIKEYNQQNQLLKLEAEYEKLQTEIVESKLRRSMAMIKYSELIAAQEQAQKAHEEESKKTSKDKENV